MRDSSAVERYLNFMGKILISRKKSYQKVLIFVSILIICFLVFGDYLYLYLKLHFFVSSAISIVIKLTLGTTALFYVFKIYEGKNIYFWLASIVFMFSAIYFIPLVDMKYVYLNNVVDKNGQSSRLFNSLNRDPKLEISRSSELIKNFEFMRDPLGNYVPYVFNHGSGVFRQCGFAYISQKISVPKFLYFSEGSGDGQRVYAARQLSQSWHYLCLYF